MAAAKRGKFWQRCKAAARHAGVRALLLLLIVLLNPFGSVEWNEKRGREIWQRLYAPVYAGSGKVHKEGHSAKGRDAIVIVTVDKEGLDKLNGDPMDGHDARDLLDVIEAVAAVPDAAAPSPGQPVPPPPAPLAALFVDLVLENAAPLNIDAETMLALADGDGPACDNASKDNPPPSAFRCLLRGIARLTRYQAWRGDADCQRNPAAKLLCIRRVGGLPVVVADSTDFDDPDAKPSEGIRALGMVAMASPARVDPAAYDLARPGKEARVNKPYQLYPAAAMYAAYCQNTANPAARQCDPVRLAPRDPQHPQKGEGSDLAAPYDVWAPDYVGWSRKFEQPLETIWGVGSRSAFTARIDQLQGGTLAHRCAVAETSPWPLAKSLASAAAAGINVEQGTPCLYTNSISFDGLGSLQHEARIATLSGKMVMIGLDRRDGADTVVIPQFGRIPAVFSHAMALDNLIEFGADYSKPPVRLANFLDVTDADMLNVVTLAILALATGFAVVILTERNQALRPGALPSRREWLERVAIGLGALFALVVIAQILVLIFAVYPLTYNFITLSIAALIEISTIFFVIVKPIRDYLARRYAVVGAILGSSEEAPKANPPKPRKKRGKRNADGDSAAAGGDGVGRDDQQLPA